MPFASCPEIRRPSILWGNAGGQASLFVRGGDSRYNKVIVDGVPVNDPGGIFDFGVVPLAGAERLEFLRGAQSTLYGSDAMTSVVQVLRSLDRPSLPNWRFGAGRRKSFHRAWIRLDRRGAGPLRLPRLRRSVQYTGFRHQRRLLQLAAGSKRGCANWATVPRSAFGLAMPTVEPACRENGSSTASRFAARMPTRGRARTILMVSAELAYVASAHWQHRATAFEYNHRTLNEEHARRPRLRCECVRFHGLLFSRCGAHQPCRA